MMTRFEEPGVLVKKRPFPSPWREILGWPAGILRTRLADVMLTFLAMVLASVLGLRGAQAQAVFTENFDQPSSPEGYVLFGGDPLYTAAILSVSARGGTAAGNAASNALIVQSFASIPNDQGGLGFFLFNNTSCSAGASFDLEVWRTQTPVQVDQNRCYVFSFFLTNRNGVPVARIRPSINGIVVGPDVSANGNWEDGSGESWQQFSFTWNSGAATSAILSLFNLEGACARNDFGIDTITLTPLDSLVTITGPADSCANPAHYSVNAIPGFTYDWTITGGTPASATGDFVDVTWTSPTGTVSVTATNALLACESSASLVRCCGGRLSGTKFADLDANGVQNGIGEVGLPGWTIQLDPPNGPTTTTDVNGHYSFTLTSPGPHMVAEVQQPGWSITAPPAGIHTVQASLCDSVVGLDFGNCSGPNCCGSKANHLLNGSLERASIPTTPRSGPRPRPRSRAGP
jgi:hypothetical protein